MDFNNLAIAANIIDELVDIADSNGELTIKQAKQVLSQYFDEPQVQLFLGQDISKADAFVAAARDNHNYPIVKLLYNQLKRAEKRLQEKQNGNK